MALVGGIGSGKTFVGACFLLRELKRCVELNDDSIGLLTASTYGQLRKATLTEVFRQFTEWGISFSYNQQAGMLTIENRKKFLCAGVDKSGVDNLRGVNVGCWWGDEAAYYDGIDVFNTLSGRIRDKRGSMRRLFTTSPAGHNYFYDLFAGELYDPKNYKAIKARTSSNVHLAEGFYDSLKTQMDEKAIAQELHGEWVSRSGTAYYQFNRDIHMVDLSRIRVGKQLIGLDFNVDPFCALVILYRDGIFYVKDEIYLEGGSDTYKMSEELISRGYGDYQIIADSTYTARRTSGKSDKRILEEYGFECLPSRNPYVIDRVQNINRLFLQNRITVSYTHLTLPTKA